LGVAGRGEGEDGQGQNPTVADELLHEIPLLQVSF
jgi:hypothetical protein